MHQIFYVTLDPEKALGVEDLIPSYHILYSGSSQLAIPIANEGIDIRAIVTKAGVQHSTAKLFEVPELLNILNKNAHGRPNILVFKNDNSIQSICRKLNYNLINPDFELSKRFENKLEFSKYLDSIDVFKKPSYFTFEKFSDLQWDEIRRNIGTKSVIQFMFGHSGNSTFFIDTKEDLEKLQQKYPERRGKVVQRIEGIPYTINACITSAGIVIGGVSEQITGIEFLTSSQGGTVGNDFGQRHLDDISRRNLIQKTMEMGYLFEAQGFKGIFGLDLIFNEEEKEFYLIEANMRQTMSCSYVSYLQRMQNQVPIMLWHILELLAHDFSENFMSMLEIHEEWINKGINEFLRSKDKIETNLKNNQPVNASQIFFRNINDKPVTVLEQFPAGIYRIRGRLPNESVKFEDDKKYPIVYPMREDGWSHLCHIKRGYRIIEAEESGGFMISTAAEKNTVPEVGELGRIQVMESAFGSRTGYELNGWIKDTINVVMENMRLVCVN